jgi:hypothetical protein
MNAPVYTDDITMGGDGTPAHPLFSVGGGGGVVSLQGESGAVNLGSIDGSVAISVPFPHVVDLRVAAIDGGTF